MQIDPAYKDYFVYTAICHNGKQVSCGACPVVAEPSLQDMNHLNFTQILTDQKD